MPRLTRMQKYADKRDQLANDKEEKVVSNDLSSYQDRLNNVENTLSFNQNDVKEEKNNINPDYTWKPFEGDSFSQPVEPIKTWENVTPVQKEVKTTIKAPVFEEPVHEKPKQEENSFFEQFMAQPVEKNKPQNDFSSYFETLNDDNSKGVFKDVTDDSGEIVSQKERDTYLNQTMSDVFSYNINNGEQTINTVIDNVVDEVRHGENKLKPVEDTESIEVIQEAPVQEEKVDPIDNTYWTPFVDTNAELDADKEEIKQEIDDEEFSNTVSMEISKMMEEMANATAATAVEEVKEESVIEEPKQKEVEETIQINEAITEEKPEEVVEIKNISEIENESVKDTMSSTIPFVVAAEDEEVEEDEDDEDGSNTVLNVILIVLIVVLVAVLGLIVFYILKTKGIF